MNEDEYEAKCGKAKQCVVKGGYGELCVRADLPSPTSQPYRKYFDCFKSSGAVCRAQPSPYKPASQNQNDSFMCKWLSIPRLTKCIENALNEEEKDKIALFQSDATFGCKVINPTNYKQAGNSYRFAVECVPGQAADPQTYCNKLTVWANQTLPMPHSVNGSSVAPLGSRQVEVKVIAPTSSNKNFPQCKTIASAIATFQ